MWFFGKKASETRPRRPFVSVRMEAIGGQGANTAGKILAEAAVLGMHFKGNHFSSFGSEKRGSPVRSFVRFSTQDQPIRSAAFIRNPNLLVIFHESLLQTHPEVLEGVDEQTDFVLNTSKKIDEIHLPMGTKFRSVSTVDATSIANQEGCGLNAVMLGAMSDLCHEINPDILMKTLIDYFSKRSPALAQKNSKGFRSGQRKSVYSSYKTDQKPIAFKSAPLPELGWRNAPIGGVILNPGNSILKDHSASRKGFAPKFLKEICFNCGLCDMVCPDYCFVWKNDEQGRATLQGLDYQYCKGCQKCIQICPVQALVLTPEEEITDEDRQQKVFLRDQNLKIAENPRFIEQLSKKRNDDVTD